MPAQIMICEDVEAYSFPVHIGPDHYLALESAQLVTKDDVHAAWELAYGLLSRALAQIPNDGKLFLVCGLQGSGKSTWIRTNAPAGNASSIYFDGPLPSRKQRSRALALAQAAGVESIAVWLNVPLQTALARNSLRPGLSAIKEEAVLHVQSLFEPPTCEEGSQQFWKYANSCSRGSRSSHMGYFLVLVVGVIAGMLSGVIGTGSSILLLPLLVERFGAKQAVPIMAIAALMSNLAKVISWWREIDWRACAAYSITGVPAAALGARTLLLLPEAVIDVALGLFFIAMIPTGRWLRKHEMKIKLWQLAVAGAVIGFITGIVLSTGPMSVPAFTSYGLVRGAFLSTEAASSLLLYVTKVVTFQQFGALPLPSIIDGLIIGASVMIGSIAGKQVVLRMSVTVFQRILEVVLFLSGLALIATAFK